MANLTNYMEDAIIQFFLRNDADTYTPPATVYLALFTTATSDTGGGTEVVGNGYAREAIAFTDPAGTGDTTSTAQIDFVANGGNWGSITHIGVFDALTTGNMLLWGQLTVARTINDGETLRFAAADVDLNLN